MGIPDIERSFINSVPFNEVKYNYLIGKLDDIQLIKNKKDILSRYIKNIETMSPSRPRKRNKKSSNTSNKNISLIKQNISDILKLYPQGLQLEKFNNIFQSHYGYFLNPSDYNFKDIIDLIKNLNNICIIKRSDNLFIVSTNTKEMGDEIVPEKAVKELKTEEKVIPENILKVFKIILDCYGGGIALDNLLPEYEFRSGERLNLAEFGLSSILELASLLSPEFKVCSVNGCQSVLYDTNTIHICPCENTTKEDFEVETNVPFIIENGRFLKNEVLNRLTCILIEEFPEGLATDELVSAYKGFYDAYSEDLNPEQYGLQNLEELLQEENEFLRISKEFGKVMVAAGAFYQERSCSSKPSLNVVPPSASFQVVDATSLDEGSFVEVIVADVYNPCKFWVVKRGKEHSIALDDLMDRMLEFYGSDLGNKFTISNENLVNLYGSPVAALYPEDENFYRAIVLSREDVQRVKLFFVDYGTNTSAPISYLRFLHKRFFDLPAQAIKSSLYGIEPTDGRTYWPKYATCEFLTLSQDKDFVAYVHENESGEKLQLTLYDTAGVKDVNINFHLVKFGLASLIKDHPMTSTPKAEQKKSESEPVAFDGTCDSRDLTLEITSRVDDGVAGLHKPPKVEMRLCSVDELRMDVENNSSHSGSSKGSSENPGKTLQMKKRTICPSKLNVTSFSFRSMEISLSNRTDSSGKCSESSTQNHPVEDILQENTSRSELQENISRHELASEIYTFSDKTVLNSSILSNGVDREQANIRKASSGSIFLNDYNPVVQRTAGTENGKTVPLEKKTSPEAKILSQNTSFQKGSNESQLQKKFYYEQERAVNYDSMNRSAPIKNDSNHESAFIGNSFNHQSAPIGSTFSHESEPIGNTFSQESVPIESIFSQELASFRSTFRNESAPIRSTFTHESTPIGNTFNHETTPVGSAFNHESTPIESTFSHESTPIEDTFSYESAPIGSSFSHESISEKKTIDYESLSVNEKSYNKDMTGFSFKPNWSLMGNGNSRNGSAVVDSVSSDDWSVFMNGGESTEKKSLGLDMFNKKAALDLNGGENDSISTVRSAAAEKGQFFISDYLTEINGNEKVYKESSFETGIITKRDDVGQNCGGRTSGPDLNESEKQGCADGIHIDLLDDRSFFLDANKITSLEMEVFYSDEEDKSTLCSTFDSDDGDQDVIPIHLPNEQVIHIVHVNSTYFIPIPELPLLLLSETLSLLNGSLLQREREEGDGPLLKISRNRYSYTFVLLAWKRVPYVFDAKGSVAKSVSVLSLQYLTTFVNQFINIEKEIVYKEFMKSFAENSNCDVNNCPPRQKETSALCSLQNSSSENNRVAVENEFISLGGNQKSLLSPILPSVVPGSSNAVSSSVKRKDSPPANGKMVIREEEKFSFREELSLMSPSNDCVNKQVSTSLNDIASQKTDINITKSTDATKSSEPITNHEDQENNLSSGLQKQNSQCSKDLLMWPPVSKNEEKGFSENSNQDLTVISVKGNQQQVESPSKTSEEITICSSNAQVRSPHNSSSSTFNSVSFDNESYPNNEANLTSQIDNNFCEYTNVIPPVNNYLPPSYYGQPLYVNTAYGNYAMIEPVTNTSLPPMQNPYPHELQNASYLWRPYMRYHSYRPRSNLFRGYYQHSNRGGPFIERLG